MPTVPRMNQDRSHLLLRQDGATQDGDDDVHAEILVRHNDGGTARDGQEKVLLIRHVATLGLDEVVEVDERVLERVT